MAKKRSIPNGLFITFEGIDGSGKSTQMDLCAKALKKDGFEVVITRNPGGMKFGEQLRDILLHYPEPLNPLSEMLLFMADRAQHMSEIILPALQEGKIILCDRHIDSTTAYQGYGRGLSLSLIHQVNKSVCQGRLPDVTMLFDGDAKLLAQRVNKRGEADRLESEKQAFHQRVRQGYLVLSRQEPQRFYVFDAMKPPQELHDMVMRRLSSMLDHVLS